MRSFTLWYQPCFAAAANGEVHSLLAKSSFRGTKASIKRFHVHIHSEAFVRALDVDTGSCTTEGRVIHHVQAAATCSVTFSDFRRNSKEVRGCQGMSRDVKGCQGMSRGLSGFGEGALKRPVFQRELASHPSEEAAYIGVVDVDDVVTHLNGQIACDAVAPKPRRVPACEGVHLELVAASTGHRPLEQTDALKVESIQITIAGGDVRVTPEVALLEALIIPVVDVTRRARGQIGRGLAPMESCQRKLA